jgi:hypothetical protein
MSLGQILDGKVQDLIVPEPAEAAPPEGFCIECEDQPAELQCIDCDDAYCQVCFTHQHRKGSRKNHKIHQIQSDIIVHESVPEEAIPAQEYLEQLEFQVESTHNFIERSKYIPLRLSYEERKFLRLLEAALGVSEYTDKIDVLMYANKSKRMVGQIKELCSILSGLVLAADYKSGQDLFQNRDFQANQDFFQKMCYY